MKMSKKTIKTLPKSIFRVQKFTFQDSWSFCTCFRGFIRGVSWGLLGSLGWAPLGSPGLPWAPWAPLGSPGLPWAPPGLPWVLLGSPGLSWAPLGAPPPQNPLSHYRNINSFIEVNSFWPPGLPWAPLGSPGLPWAPLGSPGLPWAPWVLLGFLGFPWVLLAIKSCILAVVLQGLPIIFVFQACHWHLKIT